MLQSLFVRVLAILALFAGGTLPAMAILAPGEYIPSGEEVTSVALTDIFGDSLYANQGGSLMSGVVLGQTGIVKIKVNGAEIPVSLGFMGFGQFQSPAITVQELALASTVSFFAGSEEIYFTGGIGYSASGSSYSLIFDTPGSGGSNSVPEPTSAVLAALGISLVAVGRHRRS